MTPPRWDLASFFPGFDSPERTKFESDLRTDSTALLADTAKLGAIGNGADEAWEAALLRYEALLTRLGHLSTYVTCLTSADAADERYVLAEGRLNLIRADFEKILVELRRALHGVPEAQIRGFIERPKLSGAGYFVERAREESKTSMTPDLEGLAADLGADGIMGWGRLYDTVSAKLRFTMKTADGRHETLPVAQRRSLMADPVRAVRLEAFRAGNEAWASVADVCAAALNHIAGTRHVLYEKRGVRHFLDIALRDAAISSKTLEAMLEAVKDRSEVPRRGLAIKARAMGLPAIHWCDLEAPLPLASAERIPWEKGVGLVREAFGRGLPSLATYFDSMLTRRWIEAEPREGKRPGAYCTRSDLLDETRVFMTYQGSLGDVSTLAHEVGHAFHAEVMRNIRVLGRQYPMTLAETASTFAESLLSDGLLADTSMSKETRALLLNEAVADGASFLLDIPTRFFFEKKFYEERKVGEVAMSRISELMVETQR
jgi:oligoendopeptidase F